MRISKDFLASILNGSLLELSGKGIKVTFYEDDLDIEVGEVDLCQPIRLTNDLESSIEDDVLELSDEGVELRLPKEVEDALQLVFDVNPPYFWRNVELEKIEPETEEE